MMVMKAAMALVLVVGLLAVGCSRTDERLHGRWQSDQALSAEWNRAHANFTGTSLDEVNEMMGHRTLEFLPDGSVIIEVRRFEYTIGTNIYIGGGDTNTFKYDVVESTTNWVRIITRDDPSYDFCYFNFVGSDVFWVDDMSGENRPRPREYYRRIDGTTRGASGSSIKGGCQGR